MILKIIVMSAWGILAFLCGYWTAKVRMVIKYKSTLDGFRNTLDKLEGK